MRLIDADDAKRTYTKDMFDTEEDFERVNDVLNYAPTVDAVSVVRCKDCKHRIYKDMGEEIGEIGGCGLFNCAMPNEGFCSHGERKDGGDG